MEGNSAVSSVNERSMNYAVIKNQDVRSSTVPLHPTNDAVTLPTRRQMNSVKNQFEGKYIVGLTIFCLLASIVYLTNSKTFVSFQW